MQFKDISFSSAQENLAFDEALWDLAEKQGGGEVLRFWESAQVFIVLGRLGQAEADVHLPHAQEDKIPILRRCSGGGTVVQGPGCLNFTLVLSKHKHPELHDLHKSYAWIAARVIQALRPLGVEAFFRPLSDIATGKDEKKFSGNAQRRGKHFVMHHGTLLYRFDLDLISRYLAMPKDIPEYRKGRPHSDFVANIPIDPAAFKAKLALEFNAPAP